MQMNLTVNKPATTQLAGEAPAGLKIKVEDGRIMLKFTKTEGGRDTFPLFQRTRGGLGVTLRGAMVDKLLSIKGMSSDTHMTMENAPYGWIIAQPYDGKPSKLVPTARLWRTRDEVQEKAAEPAPRAARAKASPATDKPAKAKAESKTAAKKATAKKAEAKPAAKRGAAKPKAKAATAADTPMPQAAEQAQATREAEGAAA